jgi:Clp amino terminal domain, pathogenicity island component
MTTPTNQVDYHPWTTYIHAREEARRRGDRRVGTEHLLLGLLQEPEIAKVLGTSVQAGRNMLDSLDRKAVASLGIGSFPEIPPLPARDVPARPTVKAVFKDRLPMTPASKRALQQAGKPMRRGHHITAEQVLLRILDLSPPDPAALLLAGLDIDATEVGRRITKPAT